MAPTGWLPLISPPTFTPEDHRNGDIYAERYIRNQKARGQTDYWDHEKGEAHPKKVGFLGEIGGRRIVGAPYVNEAMIDECLASGTEFPDIPPDISVRATEWPRGMLSIRHSYDKKRPNDRAIHIYVDLGANTCWFVGWLPSRVAHALSVRKPDWDKPGKPPARATDQVELLLATSFKMLGDGCCAVRDCNAFIRGHRRAEACWLCYLSNRPHGWHPGDSIATGRVPALRTAHIPNMEGDPGIDLPLFDGVHAVDAAKTLVAEHRHDPPEEVPEDEVLPAPEDRGVEVLPLLRDEAGTGASSTDRRLRSPKDGTLTEWDIDWSL